VFFDDRDVDVIPGNRAADEHHAAIGVPSERLATRDEALGADSDHSLTLPTRFRRLCRVEAS
jgi:hypothetical protein